MEWDGIVMTWLLQFVQISLSLDESLGTYWQTFFFDFQKREESPGRANTRREEVPYDRHRRREGRVGPEGREVELQLLLVSLNLSFTFLPGAQRGTTGTMSQHCSVPKREREREREVSSISQDKNNFKNEVSGLKGK